MARHGGRNSRFSCEIWVYMPRHKPHRATWPMYTCRFLWVSLPVLTAKEDPHRGVFRERVE